MSMIRISGFVKQWSGIDHHGTLTDGNFEPVVTYAILKVNKTRHIPLFLKFISNAFGAAYEKLKVDFVLANPPFNNNDWSGDRLRSGPMEVWCKIKLSLNPIKYPIKDKY